MNLFRSEAHVQRWPLYVDGVDDLVLPVSDWARVFSVPMYRDRLRPDYLTYADSYVDGYDDALREVAKAVPAHERRLLTVLFTDIVGSTTRAAQEGDDTWRQLLDRHDTAVRDCIAHFRGREIKQTGDGFLVAFEAPAMAIRCAAAIRDAVRGHGLRARAGIHSGECEIRGEDLGGIAVHIGARIASLAGPDEVLVSRTVTEAVLGAGIDFDPRGGHELKGVPGIWQIHAARL